MSFSFNFDTSQEPRAAPATAPPPAPFLSVPFALPREECREESVVVAEESFAVRIKASAAAADQARASDLVPGVYEGGLKIWECALDLVHYLLSRIPAHVLPGKRVLELGCGAGLPGIAALRRGAAVDFQDYNTDVLECLTMPTVAACCPQQAPSCGFFSGDWTQLHHLPAYDVILTSETVYNPASYTVLLQLFKRVLRPGGFILLAAKTYYFGVGGSLRAFEAAVRTDGVFACSRVFHHDHGVSREILRLEYAS